MVLPVKFEATSVVLGRCAKWGTMIGGPFASPCSHHMNTAGTLHRTDGCGVHGQAITDRLCIVIFLLAQYHSNISRHQLCAQNTPRATTIVLVITRRSQKRPQKVCALLAAVPQTSVRANWGHRAKSHCLHQDLILAAIVEPHWRQWLWNVPSTALRSQKVITSNLSRRPCILTCGCNDSQANGCRCLARLRAPQAFMPQTFPPPGRCDGLWLDLIHTRSRRHSAGDCTCMQYVDTYVHIGTCRTHATWDP